MEAGTIWLLVCAALVLFMTPGLAFFYGGLVKAKSVVSMMMLSFGAMGLVFVLWVLYGYNMGSNGSDVIDGWLANPFSDFALSDMAANSPEGLAGVAFGSTFAVITTALISGAVADRARFLPWMIFAGIWATLVYFPSQGWVWGFDDEGLTGWIGTFTVGDAAPIDWAGGTVVHISAGAAALALALVLGKRVTGFTKEDAVPHNVPLVLIGAAILWFGWFGFNTGAAIENGQGALIFLNTIVAPAAGLLGFVVIEHLKEGKATAVGAASGVVAGLVAITPACANLTPFWSIVLGLVAGIACAFAIDLKYKLGYDDSLDVVGLHLVAGVLGCLYLGFFATDTGLFVGGNIDQLVAQVVPVVVVMAYSFAVAFAVATVLDKTIGFRVKEEDEVAGIDTALHGAGYAFD
ncbi:ammonium transporter [Aeromicrobium sp. IC_218]|uniref:ammonium transporter n=1 Tax=Aeromicrobium sp. IC_218 TaxID=2545468 RepID=UPI00103905A3|nr:ammonium transporter [Aeromicrobium sp. IC_218]TCJ00304.1 ammonium transporter [Aeromicrobium sp. IC_218]